MQKGTYELNILMKLSLILIPIPVIFGVFLESSYGIKSFYYLLVVMAPFYLKGFKNFLINLNLLLTKNGFRSFIIYVLLSIFALVYSIDVKNGVSIILVLVTAVFVGLIFTNYNLFKIYKYFSWSSLIYITLLYFDVPRLFLSYSSNLNRFGYYHGDINLNPNSFSIYISSIAIYFLYTLFTEDKITNKIVNILPLITLIFFIIQTQSRSGLLTFIFITFIAIFRKRKMRNFIINSFLVSLLLICLLIMINTDLKIESRLTDADLNGRENIWNVGLTASTQSLSSFIFGYGTGSAERVIGPNYSGYTIIDKDGLEKASPHNMYIENFLNIGILGVLLFIYSMLAIYIYILKKSDMKSAFLPLGILQILLISGFVGNNMRSYFYIFTFSIVVGYLIQINKKEINT